MRLRDVIQAIIKDGAPIEGTPNYLHIRTKALDNSAASAAYFNKIFKSLKKSKIQNIDWSPSGGIRTAGRLLYSDMWGIKRNSFCVELTAILWIDDERFACRWQFGRGNLKLGDRTLGYSGRKALTRAKEDAKKFGFDLEELAIENGKEIKSLIPKPLIWADEDLFLRTHENANHLDFHSSHPFGMFEAFPVLEPMIRFWFELRHKSEVYKNQLNMFWGACQSLALCGAKWANLSKAGIESTNRRVLEIVERLKAAGRKILALNTDGVWYVGEPYHGKGEGSDIGEWSNDHINCKIRFKSTGVYEFIENGKYNVVARGRTKYDDLVDRSKWEWGDIFRDEVIVKYFEFDEEEGIVEVSEERARELEEIENIKNEDDRIALNNIIKYN